MGRIRTIKPEFWTDERLSELPEATHMLAAALLNYADDEGYFNANERLIQAACCPLREPSVSVHESLAALQQIGYIRTATAADGRRYGWIVNFDKHQKVNRPSPSKIKDLADFSESSLNAHGGLTEDSLPEQGTGNGEVEQGMEGKGTGGNTPPPFNPEDPPIPPALDSQKFRDTWIEWIRFRRKKRHSVDESCIRRQVTSLADIGAANALACLEIALTNGYQGLPLDRFKNGRQQQGANRVGPGQRYQG